MNDTQRLAAEALAAVTGIPRLLEAKPKPVTEADAAKAIKLAREVEEIFKEYFDSEEFRRQKDDVPELDYMETLGKLTRPVEQGQREALIDGFSDHEAGLTYLDVLDKGIAWLLGQLPRLSRPTLVGDIPVEPSQNEMAVFEWEWQVACDPLQVLRDMSEGIMVTAQVDAFKAMFPTLYARTALTLQGVLIDRRAKEKDWEPPIEKSWQAFTFFGLSPVDPDLAAKLQAQSHAAVQQGEQQDQQPLNISIDSGATPNQKLANE